MFILVPWQIIEDSSQIIPFLCAFLSFGCGILLVKEHVINFCAFKCLSLFEHAQLDWEHLWFSWVLEG